MTTTAKPIRWGILGTGLIARQFTEGLKSLPDATLAAVGSRDARTAQAFADALGFARAHSSYQALVDDPDVDIIYIATPHTRHKDDCLLALKAGKAVLCEKPFATSADDARAVFALAAEKKLFCMEAMWMRCMPLIAEARALIESMAIGEVRLLTADFGYAVVPDLKHRLFDPALGGGALLDRGVYPLALAWGLFGAPSRMQSQARFCASGADEQVSLLLDYQNGPQAVLSASLTSQLSNEAVIHGTHGEIRLHAPFYKPVRLSLTQRQPQTLAATGAPARAGAKQKFVGRIKQSAAGQWLIEAISGSALRRRGYTRFKPLSGNGYHYEAAEAMRCLRAGLLESPLMPQAHSVEILAALDDIRRDWASH
ncbi:MAG: Gfo/Idh/MocA family oxidoreductase [Pseudomonadota bacterium]